jgi:hypothetical protein
VASYQLIGKQDIEVNPVTDRSFTSHLQKVSANSRATFGTLINVCTRSSLIDFILDQLGQIVELGQFEIRLVLVDVVYTLALQYFFGYERIRESFLAHHRLSRSDFLKS